MRFVAQAIADMVQDAINKAEREGSVILKLMVSRND